MFKEIYVITNTTASIQNDRQISSLIFAKMQTALKKKC